MQSYEVHSRFFGASLRVQVVESHLRTNAQGRLCQALGASQPPRPRPPPHPGDRGVVGGTAVPAGGGGGEKGSEVHFAWNLGL